jgi:phosphoglycolate phosphatase
MKKSVELVMFDLDGTLADTGQDLAASVNFTRGCFKLASLPEHVIFGHVGRGVEHLLRHTLPEQAGQHFQEVTRLFLEHYEHHLLDRTVLYQGVHDVLDYFCHKRRAIVSNKIGRLTVAIARGLGVEKCFDAILGGDNAAEKKPHPALLNIAMERFCVAPAHALMVGDGDTDVEAGKRAGVITCGVTYGLSRKEDLIAAKPDVIINHLGALLDHFR